MKELLRINTADANPIKKFLYERLIQHPDPKALASLMVGHRREYWRFRVGNFRLICKIEDKKLTIVIVRLGHRREIYD